MSDAVAAVLIVFVFGFLTGVAFAAALRRGAGHARPSRDASVALRLRAVRRSRATLVSQRLDALEEAVNQDHPVRRQRDGATGATEPVPDDAVTALRSLGYPTKAAVAALTRAGPHGSTEQAVLAALKVMHG